MALMWISLFLSLSLSFTYLAAYSLKNLRETSLNTCLKRMNDLSSEASWILHPCKKSSLFFKWLRESFKKAEWKASIIFASLPSFFSMKSRMTKLFYIQFIKALPKFLNTFFWRDYLYFFLGLYFLIAFLEFIALLASFKDSFWPRLALGLFSSKTSS